MDWTMFLHQALSEHVEVAILLPNDELLSNESLNIDRRIPVSP